MSLIKVKVSTSNPELSNLLLRQTPRSIGRWGSCQFFVNDPVEQCDWWFVCHESALQKSQTCICDPGHIAYISMEPRDLHSDSFYRQFSRLILCDPRIQRQAVFRRNGVSWWAGINVGFEDGHRFSPEVNHDYDSFCSMVPPRNKLNRISIVTSKKDFWPGHRARLDFIDKLRRSCLADRIDFYGHGHNPIDDKLEAILPYRYHLVLENTVLDHYWTEKLADAYLGYAFPLYHGCSNIGDYFPVGSFHRLDICSESAISQLKAVLDSDLYDSSIPLINDARNRVLNDYNLFALMSSIAVVKARRLKRCVLHPPGCSKSLVGSVSSRIKRTVSRLLP